MNVVEYTKKFSLKKSSNSHKGNYAILVTYESGAKKAKYDLSYSDAKKVEANLLKHVSTKTMTPGKRIVNIEVGTNEHIQSIMNSYIQSQFNKLHK